jgi:type IV pilus assembly protein PilY1
MTFLSGLTRACGAQALLAVATALLTASALAQTPPSQRPLIARDGGTVKPNVVLTLDTSGSMINQYMPSGSFRVGAYTVTFSNDYGGVVMHPADPRIYVQNFRGVIPADPADAGHVLQRQMRSADVNTLYYNPAVTYLPWYEAGGARMAAPSPAAAPFDPYGWTTAATANLTAATAPVTLGAPVNTRAWCDSIVPAVEPAHGITCSAGTRSFAPGLYYRLKRDGSGQPLDPNVAANYDAFDINNPPAAGFPKPAGRTDCVAVPGSCSQAEERQNFTNWFVFYRSRLLLVQTAVPEAFVAQGDNMRLGWGVLDKAASDVDGQPSAVVERGVRDYTAVNRFQFFNFLRNRNVDGFTPLRQALYGVGQYFSRTDHRGPWSDDPSLAGAGAHAHKTCRRSYNILVTDGYWNNLSAPFPMPTDVGNSDNTAGPLHVGTSGQNYQYQPAAPYRDDRFNQEGDGLGTLADVAMHFWKRDLRPDLENKVPASVENPAFWQHMVNFTVGLGVSGQLDPATDLAPLAAGTKVWGNDRIDDLWHAALNSRGAYFSARTPAELANSMRSALEKTNERELKESGVATAVASLQENNRKYVPRYRSGSWTGDVEAFGLDAAGNAGSTPLWSAEAKLGPWNARRIVTWDPSVPQGVSFTFATISAASRAALGPAATQQSLIDFIRGDRSAEGTTWRQRRRVLADFVNTTPVFAKRSFTAENALLPTIGGTYTGFWSGTKTSRDGVLYVGGNGGMLHGFRDTNGVTPTADGTEVFAYVPRAVYPSLSTFASPTYGSLSNFHTYFVDGPLREADVHVEPPGGGAPQWRNYLLGSTGAGARAVFALDVTDPNALGAASVRWEMSSADDSDLGHVLFPIATGPLPNGHWVAVFGNGYGSTAQRAYLFVKNLTTGALQKVAVAPAVGNNGLGGVAVVRGPQGYIEALYAGDLQGNFWRFDVTGNPGSEFAVANGGAPLFQARDAGGTAQPILQPPAIFAHSGGGRVLVFGTGRLVTDADADTTGVQTIYGVRDNPPESIALPLTRANLASRTIVPLQGTGAASGQTFFTLNGTAVNWNAQRGWAIDLTIAGYAGLRVVYPPQAPTSRFAYVSTVSPAQNLVACDESFGRAVDFILPIETGLASTDNVMDTSGDGVIDAQDVPTAGFATRADGAKTLVSGTRPPARLGQATPCQRFVSLNTVDKTDLCLPGGSVTGIRDRTWRRLINPPLR